MVTEIVRETVRVNRPSIFASLYREGMADLLFESCLKYWHLFKHRFFYRPIPSLPEVVSVCFVCLSTGGCWSLCDRSLDLFTWGQPPSCLQIFAVAPVKDLSPFFLNHRKDAVRTHLYQSWGGNESDIAWNQLHCSKLCVYTRTIS